MRNYGMAVRGGYPHPVSIQDSMDKKRRYLDDAIMVEFVASELTHEIAAYEDFSEYRKSRPKTGEPARLGARRETHQPRMRRRRRHERSRRQSRGSSSSSRIRLW